MQQEVMEVDQDNLKDNSVTVEKFWRKTLEHFITVRPQFCLQNIEFYSEKLFGLAKYPINVWN